MQPKPWRGLGVAAVLTFLLLTFLAAFSLIVPFLDRGFRLSLAQASSGTGVLNWFINGGGNWVVLLAAVALFALLLFFVRARLNQDKALWFDTGCPQCEERELVRVARQRGDRYYGWLGVRAYRYACRNCAWRGLRIGHRHHHLPPSTIATEADPLIDPNDLIAAAGPAVPQAPLAAPAAEGAVTDITGQAATIAAFAKSLDNIGTLQPAVNDNPLHLDTAPAAAAELATGQSPIAMALEAELASEISTDDDSGTSGVAAALEKADPVPDPIEEFVSALDTPTARSSDDEQPPASLADEHAATFSEDELEWLWRRLSENK